MSPIDLPLMHILSPKSPITNDAVISLIVNSSSATFAHISPAFLLFCSYVAIPIVSFIISTPFTISDIKI